MPCRTRRRDIAIMRYRVTALYDFPPVERGIVVEADTPEHAMVQAVLEGLLPVAFERDAHAHKRPNQTKKTTTQNQRTQRPQQAPARDVARRARRRTALAHDERRSYRVGRRGGAAAVEVLHHRGRGWPRSR